MAEPVRARRLTDQEGQRLQQIVRRGKHESVRVRRAMIIMASASGTLVPAIARLVAADEDTVRDVIHAFNAKGLAALDPQRAGGRPRLISDGDIEVIVTAARTRPEKLGRPFTRWSLRKLAACLAEGPGVCIGRERLRQVLHARGISFQRTRTWKESPDPDRDASGGRTLAALRSVRAARPGGYRLFVIMDNLPADKTPAIRSWAQRENAGLCFTPTSASWANPIEAQSGPLRTFVMGGSDHPDHTVLARRLQACLRWRNAHARHPGVLAAQRRERARIRSERQQRRGRPKSETAQPGR